MRIAETFFSIQGEGVLAGVPSLFIRTTGCNLRCVWCDTPYTSWQPEGVERSIESLAEEARATACRHVVLTGGEPMIQPQIGALAAAIHVLERHITIETAGTVFCELPCQLMSISPKLANSTPHAREDGRWAAAHDRLRYQPDVLRALMQRYEYQLKFVVASPGDVEEIRAIAAELEADAARILLMPEGTSADVLAGRAGWIVETCKQFGYRYSPRLHIELWGNRRGV